MENSAENPFKYAKKIRIDREPEKDEYALYVQNFTAGRGRIILKICAETDYIAEINGHTAGFCAFAGYRDEKFYDEIDITKFTSKGENSMEVTVRYEGMNSATHIDDGTFLIFEIEEEGKIIAASGKDTLGGLHGGYVQHEGRIITGQLGLTCNMKKKEKTFLGKCTEISKDCAICKRPVKMFELLPEEYCKMTETANVFDVGRETAGYVHIKIMSGSDQKVTLSWGEHLTDGRVQRFVGGRDFSMDFLCGEGENDFTNLFVRTAGRFFQCDFEGKGEVVSLGILPALYPVEEKEIPEGMSEIDRKIYETCVRTLRLCMHTHYEDCPWREQALYVLDSRNQMLCGYDAFRETDFARANLVFISKGMGPDGLLELTYPAVNTPAIPFFSVMYPVAVWEYIENTGDVSVITEVMPALRSIMDKFTELTDEKNLIPNLPAPYWNFYEWSSGNDGAGELFNDAPRPVKYDLILNCAYVLACEKYMKLCEIAGVKCILPAENVKTAVKNTFFDSEKGLFVSSTLNPVISVLGNAFACLIGLGNEKMLKILREWDGEASAATLSMKGYVYDARLAAGEKIENIIDDIRKVYGKMLSEGATSFWETEKGRNDFDGAGSLCHGWSAMPIHYYNIAYGKNRHDNAK